MAKTTTVKAHKRLSETGKIENVDAHLRKMSIGGGRHVLVRKETDPSFVKDKAGNTLTFSTTFNQNMNERYKGNEAMQRNTVASHINWISSGKAKNSIQNPADFKKLKAMVTAASKKFGV